MNQRAFVLIAFGLVLGCGGSSLSAEEPTALVPPQRDPTFEEMLSTLAEHSRADGGMLVRLDTVAFERLGIEALTPVLENVRRYTGTATGARVCGTSTTNECFTLAGSDHVRTELAGAHRTISGFEVTERHLVTGPATLFGQSSRDPQAPLPPLDDVTASALAARIVRGAPTSLPPGARDAMNAVGFETAKLAIAGKPRARELRQAQRIAGESLAVFESVEFAAIAVNPGSDRVDLRAAGFALNASNASTVASSAQQLVASFQSNPFVQLIGLAGILERVRVSTSDSVVIATTYVTLDEARMFATRFSSVISNPQ
jgi:hypothetical protein